jgi:ketosteroid isomerase-like protein
MDTQTVLDRHLAAFGAADVEAVLADYADDAVMLTADAALKGKQALRTMFGDLFDGLFKPGTYGFGMDSLRVESDVAQIIWHASCAAANIPLGTDTFVVRGGKIVAHTFAAKLEPTG